ncbi:Flp pilus assembly protein TadG [Sphingomonas sp. F9_3S_D5_B_2]
MIKRARNLLRDSSGLATLEFAIASTTLMVGLLNGLEVARWSYQKMELANAVHSAAQAAWNACDTKHLPATTKCTGLSAAVTNALAATSLGSGVTATTGYPTEAYYCVNSSGVLTSVGPVSAAKPADCSGVSDTAHVPGDYVVISASYTYSPLFGSNLTAGGFLPATLTKTGYIRLQ